jgi:ubiquitin-protein ligase
MDYDYIVPRGLLITDSDSSKRLYREQQKLTENFRQFSFAKNSRTGELYATGALRTNAGNVYPVRIELPSDYPHSIPSIFAVGWNSDCPHVYRAGNLCIMRPDQWRSFYSLAFVVAKVAIWLNKFDVYRTRGYWPGNEQQH